jgi:hypothetical protein
MPIEPWQQMKEDIKSSFLKSRAPHSWQVGYRMRIPLFTGKGVFFRRSATGKISVEKQKKGCGVYFIGWFP